jgi:putative transcriptional regulator
MIEQIPYSDLKKGTFLIASPEINSGLFFRSVVLLCEHSSIGSFGLITNKPLEVDLPEDLIPNLELTNTPIQVRAGGPTQPHQLIFLHSLGKQDHTHLEVCEGVYLGGDLDFLQEDSTSEDFSSILMYLGYSTWEGGALEQEFMQGAWFLQSASKKHIFETPPNVMWQTILREMGGKYKTLSMMPDNLELN